MGCMQGMECMQEVEGRREEEGRRQLKVGSNLRPHRLSLISIITISTAAAGGRKGGGE